VALKGCLGTAKALLKAMEASKKDIFQNWQVWHTLGELLRQASRSGLRFAPALASPAHASWLGHALQNGQIWTVCC
jgi:hypothetical protein